MSTKTRHAKFRKTAADASRRSVALARDAYLALVRDFPLVSIQSERQLVEAQKVVDRLLQKSPLTAGEEQYLDALGDLIAIYENSHDEFPAVTTPQLLAHLLEARGVTQASVARETGLPRSTVSELLSGKRTISLSHIGPLAKFFHVPQSVFLTGSKVHSGHG